jgi:hypothetical protein
MITVMFLVYVGNTRSHDICLRLAENAPTCYLHGYNGAERPVPWAFPTTYDYHYPWLLERLKFLFTFDPLGVF